LSLLPCLLIKSKATDNVSTL